MKLLVLYHDNCPDGFTAAWAAWKALGDMAHYVPVNYGQPPKLEEARGRDVYLVDFCYPRAVLDDIAAMAESVTIFDHHKTAQADLEGWAKGHVVFDMERSGAGITWDELHKAPRPVVVSYAEDMDLWRWALNSSRQVREVIFLSDRTFQAWDELEARLRSDFAKQVNVGAALLEAKRVRVATVCKNVRWVTLGGHRIPVVNHAWDMSELGEYLAEQHPEAPCGGYYFDRSDKRQWGFRSRGDFDVSLLCQKYGGGGHKGAAGFVSEIGWLPE